MEKPEEVQRLGPSMRWLLMACGPMNVIGAIGFLPLFPVTRNVLGLADSDPFFLWVLSAWILAFGVAYSYQAWSARANRMVLMLGAWGKAVFALQLIARAITGQAPDFAAIAGLPDLVCALVFVAWLWRHRPAKVLRKE